MKNKAISHPKFHFQLFGLNDGGFFICLFIYLEFYNDHSDHLMEGWEGRNQTCPTACSVILEQSELKRSSVMILVSRDVIY